MSWYPDWALGVPMIVLNVVVHVFGLGLVSGVVARMSRRGEANRGFVLRLGLIISVAALLATILHALEAILWAGVYWLFGARNDPASAILYSLSAITSYGHADVYLAVRWQLLGAMEALNGMLLFGLTTAFLFAMIQRLWPDRI